VTTRMTAAEYHKQIPKVGGRRTTPETALKHACIQYLRLQGWLTYPLIQQGITPVNLRGLPDRIAIKNGRTVYLEFKSPQGRLSEHQEARRMEIEAAGATYLVVRRLEDLYALGDERQLVIGESHEHL
jgi:hypothetical protein